MPQTPKGCISPPEGDSNSTHSGNRQRAVAVVVLVGLLAFLVFTGPDHEAGVVVDAVLDVEEEGLRPVPWAETGAMPETTLREMEARLGIPRVCPISLSELEQRHREQGDGAESSPGAKTKKHSNPTRRKKADEAGLGGNERNVHEEPSERRRCDCRRGFWRCCTRSCGPDERR